MLGRHVQLSSVRRNLNIASSSSSSSSSLLIVPIRQLQLPRRCFSKYQNFQVSAILKTNNRAWSSTKDIQKPSKRRRITMVDSNTTIVLDDREQKIRQILVGLAEDIDNINNNNKEDEKLVLRITGGWVRDKLLNGESHDIDIGINKMTGFDFASRIKEFLEKNTEKFGIQSRSVHKIESNPERSKHLETATTRLLDLDIDFVNLRSESYSAESRIPQMEFGTPKQDAMRRDATVNALFYNLHTEQIEDFTESGLQDMEKRLIRTPLAPYETFKDDPLRVLRLIRFASRLDFKIVDEVQDAMRNEEIKTFLRQKISRERIGVEVEKMLLGPNPFAAMQTFHQLGLFDAVFTPDSLEIVPDLPRDNIWPAILALKYILDTASKEHLPRVSKLVQPGMENVAWTIAALTPWGKHETQEKRITIMTAAAAAKYGLKMKNKDVEIINQAFKNYVEVQKVVRENNSQPLSRKTLGLFIRKLGENWRLQMLSALLFDLIPVWKITKNAANDDSSDIIQYYEVLLHHIENQDLNLVWNLKSIVNGNELSKAYGLKSGSWMKEALDRVLDWQLENPQASKVQAMDFAMSFADDYRKQ